MFGRGPKSLLVLVVFTLILPESLNSLVAPLFVKPANRQRLTDGLNTVLKAQIRHNRHILHPKMLAKLLDDALSFSREGLGLGVMRQKVLFLVIRLVRDDFRQFLDALAAHRMVVNHVNLVP